MTFYLALLDSECIIVLGHNWLTHYNPLIDWVLSSLTFWTPAPSLLAPPSTPSPVQSGNPVSGLSGQSDPGLAPSVDTPVCTPLHISLINAAAFVPACKLEGSTKYQLQLRPSDTAKARSSSASTPPDLDIVPPEYRDYADVFSKAKASELPPHRDYDLKKVLPHLWGLSTHCLRSSSPLSGPSSTRTSIQVSSVLPLPPTLLRSSS